MSVFFNFMKRTFKNNGKKVFLGLIAIVFISMVAICLINPRGLNKLLAGISDIPNPNFNDKDFYSCVIDSYNAEKNTNKYYTENLTDEELASLKTLSCSIKVTNTTGLLKLTGLKVLKLSSVGSDGVIDLSENKELEDIDLFGTSLISLDLSNNPNLKKLKANNTGIMSVDLANNVLLEELDLSKNTLYHIDLTSNVNLKKLNLSRNFFSYVDLTNNINLEEVYIDNIRQLFDVELGQKPKLKIFSIKKTEYEYENDVEYLDLSGVNESAIIYTGGSPLKKVKKTEGMDYTGKEYLMYENDFQYVASLSGVQRRIELRDNKVIEPKYKLALRDSYTYENNETTYYHKMEVNEYIDVDDLISSLGLKNLTAKVFKGSVEVTSGNIEEGQLLRIYDNNSVLLEVKLTLFINDKFNDSVFQECVLRGYRSVDKSATTLENADLSLISSLDCSTVPGYVYDAKGIELLTNLKTLNLSDQAVESIDLSNNLLLTHLYLGNNDIKNIDLSSNLKLEYLDLSYNKIESTNDIILNKNTDTNVNSTLSTLNLEGNLLTQFKVKFLQGIKDLSLSNNYINKVDISENKNLESISLKLNNLNSSEDIIWGNLTNLKTVDLSLNELDNIDLSTLVNLTRLILFHNDLSFSKSSKKGLDLSKNTNLTSVMIASTNLEELDLSKNNSLSNVNLVGNKKLKKVNFNNNSADLYGMIIGNGIEKIDLYNAKNFGMFYIFGSKLDSINSCLNSNNIDYEKLSTQSGMNLCNNENFIYLYLTDSPIKKIDMKAALNFSGGLFLNGDLKEIDLSNNKTIEMLYTPGNNLNLETNYLLKGTKKKLEENIILYENYKLTYSVENKNIVDIENNIIEGKEIGKTLYEGNLSSNSGSIIFREKQNINSLDGEIIVYNISSDKYIINHDKKYIYTSIDVDEHTILSNITIEMLEPKFEDNKIKLIDNGNIVDEYQIINVQFKKYKLLNKSIYTNGHPFDISNVIVANATVEYKNDKLYIKDGDIELDSFNVVTKLLGDVNEDGKVNLSDVSKLYRYIKLQSIKLNLIEIDLIISDVNFDNKISLSDVSKLYRYVRGSLSSLEDV